MKKSNFYPSSWELALRARWTAENEYWSSPAVSRPFPFTTRPKLRHELHRYEHREHDRGRTARAFDLRSELLEISLFAAARGLFCFQNWYIDTVQCQTILMVSATPLPPLSLRFSLSLRSLLSVCTYTRARVRVRVCVCHDCVHVCVCVWVYVKFHVCLHLSFPGEYLWYLNSRYQLPSEKFCFISY